MAFDNATRKRLNDFVGDARALIAEEFTQQFQSLYGISAKGEITPIDQLRDLNETELAAAAVLRARIDYLIRSHPAQRDVERAAVDRLAREQAFTVLNRLAAVRMAEKRGLIVESVGRAYQSKGFQVFERVAGGGLGESYSRYRRYLFCLFDELAVDLGVLFDRRLPQALLFPREPKLLELLGLLNEPELDTLWAEDETIGWIYQYYNDETERKKMRKESSAPRSSRELAVRNQFFTPRYVVEFLTDNTLGRLWYEMREGQTALKEQCRYLVRRPTEIFLRPGESAPKGAKERENPSQEEIRRQSIHIIHRPLKDPREVRLLDPACGSMHFGLYAFDLFSVIYDEAWEIAHGPEDAAKSAETFAPFVTFAASFPDKAAFVREVPRLIVEHNIHGIDIDPRAAQIAGLSLWLRAQRAWHEANVKPADRPRITRSNLVCAESMPGEKELLREFVEQQFPPGERRAFGFLLEKIFDHMTLAGEAGSLLRIEEEIRAAIAEARALAQSQSAPKQSRLFAGDEQFEQPEFDLAGLTDEQFWLAAEHRIYDALGAYAEQAESGRGFRRRLFADDAAQGFAFIDLCRKRYDVVVMNPPFGATTKDSKQYLVRRYPITKSELYAAFVERGLGLISSGSLGAITSRSGFFQSSFEKWRTQILLPTAPPFAVADLGGGVLDGAMVETVAYCLERKRQGASTFIRLGRETHKGTVLLSSVEAGRMGASSDTVYLVNPHSFSAIPGSPFAYWVPRSVQRMYKDFPPYEEASRSVKQGLVTSDDFRFVRAFWEVESARIGNQQADAQIGRHWFLYPKGGEFSPFYADIPLVVNWFSNGAEIKAECDRKYSHIAGYQTFWVVKNPDVYFLPGLTYPRRLHRLAVMPLPAGSLISERGSGIYGPSHHLFRIAGLLSSAAFDFLVKSMLGRFGHPQFDNGTLNRTPVPRGFPENGGPLEGPTERAIQLKRQRDTVRETSHLFCRPIVVNDLESIAATATDWLGRGDQVLEQIAEFQEQIDNAAFSLYGFDEEGRNAVFAAARFVDDAGDEDDIDEEEEVGPDKGDVCSLASSLISYAFGAAFGRWDIRFATGERSSPELPDPFAPLPVCPPGMLQDDDGLPLSPAAGRRLRVEGRYALDVAWDGILVDDPEHPLDLERRVRAALKVIWGDRTDDIEHEACSILSVPNLGEWFRRPAGFFADHLKRYSKSRRQAPIYWPLSTASGSYTLWLYYHRITDQTLHSSLADFIEPKIKSLETELGHLREKKLMAKVAEKQEFLDELRELKTEIEQLIKLPWRPNLNDGVLITAAPLWKLFRHSKWQNDLKSSWEELQAGDYDWAHLAYTIWPQRVKEKCKTDRSLAIAHGLEDLCEVEAPKPKKPKSSKKSKAAVEGEELTLEQAEAKPTRTTPKVSTPRPASTSSGRASARNKGFEPPISIEDTDRDDVMCVIRQVFSRGGAREREDALKQVSEALGYERLGAKVREVLETDLLTAVRRDILTNEDGMLSLTSGDIRDFDRDSLKDDFLTALGRTWKDREEAIRQFARFLGYARTGPTIEETARSLINGLIRDNRIERDGERIRRA